MYDLFLQGETNYKKDNNQLKQLKLKEKGPNTKLNENIQNKSPNGKNSKDFPKKDSSVTNLTNITSGNCSTMNYTNKKSAFSSDSENMNNTIVHINSNNLNITKRINSGRRETNINNESKKNLVLLNENNEFDEKNKNKMKINTESNIIAKNCNNDLDNKCLKENNSRNTSKFGNQNFISKNYATVNEILEPIKNMRIEKRQKIKSISPNLKFLDLFDDKDSNCKHMTINKNPLLDNKNIKILKSKNFKTAADKNRQSINFKNNPFSDNETTKDKNRKIPSNLATLTCGGEKVNSLNGKKIKNFERIVNNTSKNSEKIWNKELNVKNSENSIYNNSESNFNKKQTNKLLLKINISKNSFLSNCINDLKNNIGNDLKEQLINEIVNNLDECDLNFQDLLKISFTSNFAINKENLLLAEKLESKIIVYYEKLINFLQEKNLNDYHILTNEYFLNRICNNIFSLLDSERKFNTTSMTIPVLENMNENQVGKNLDAENVNLTKENELKCFDRLWKIKSKAFDLLINLLNNLFACPLIIKEIIDKEKSIILLKKLNSMNSEERMLSKLIIYKIICSSVKSRATFIKLIGYFFNSQIYDNFYHKCFLEKDEIQKYFFIEENLDLLKNLIPIIKKDYAKFHWKEIKQFFFQLAEKDEIFLRILLTSILKFWPRKYPERIINFLELIETILNKFFDENLNLIKKKNCKNNISKGYFENNKLNNNNPELNTENNKEESNIKINHDKTLNKIFSYNDNVDEEIRKIQDENFDYQFYLYKILYKLLISLKDSNFLIADRSMVTFKNEKIIKQFINNNLEYKLIDNLIFNIKFHWSQDIKMISNLVIIKIITMFPEIFSNISEENKMYIQVLNSNINTQKEDIWDIQFNLIAD